ncbi:MAG: hypothetical protein OXJ52_01700 [Oligoflexia bacterium]|nr:hypothetical protein [Oligoflexia bacterium]
MSKIFFTILFIFVVNAKATASTSIFLTCDQLNDVHYLIGCCTYNKELGAYVSNKKNILERAFTGERKYHRWQSKHKKAWYPPGVREHDLLLYYPEKEILARINLDVKLKISKCYDADFKEVNYYGIPLWPIPTGKASKSTKVSCNQPYSDPPMTCQQITDNLPSEILKQ